MRCISFLACGIAPRHGLAAWNGDTASIDIDGAGTGNLVLERSGPGADVMDYADRRITVALLSLITPHKRELVDLAETNSFLATILAMPSSNLFTAVFDFVWKCRASTSLVWMVA